MTHRPRRDSHAIGLLIALLVLVSAHPTLHADTGFQLRPFAASYRLSRNGISLGRVELSLETDAKGGYEYRAHSFPIGLVAVFREDEITETSRGLLGESGVRPLHYRFTRRNEQNTRFTELEFDWPQLRVSNRSDASHWRMDIPEGTQDKFSVQLAVMMALARGDRSISFSVADGGKLKRYEFRVMDQPVIDTSLGPLETLRIRRSKQSRPPDAVFWFAPTLNYLPVQIDRRKDDVLYRMELGFLE